MGVEDDLYDEDDYKDAMDGYHSCPSPGDELEKGEEHVEETLSITNVKDCADNGAKVPDVECANNAEDESAIGGGYGGRAGTEVEMETEGTVAKIIDAKTERNVGNAVDVTLDALQEVRAK